MKGVDTSVRPCVRRSQRHVAELSRTPGSDNEEARSAESAALLAELLRYLWEGHRMIASKADCK